MEGLSDANANTYPIQPELKKPTRVVVKSAGDTTPTMASIRNDDELLLARIGYKQVS